MEGDRVTYKIWLEVEKHTWNDKLDNDVYEDVTEEFNSGPAAFETDDKDNAKAAVEAIQRYGKGLQREIKDMGL